MKVILTSNIKKLGKIGEQVNVKDGFARNYLFPKKLALRNTDSNLKYFEKIKDEIKKAYRKLTRENHPDTLIAQGMPQEFVEVANEKMAKINAAYASIKKQRSLS